MSFLLQLVLAQSRVPPEAQDKPELSVGALVAMIVVGVIGGIGMNALMASVVKKKLLQKGYSRQDAGAIFWAYTLGGPIVGMIVKATKKPRGAPGGYGQAVPRGRAMSNTSGRRRRAGPPLPGGSQAMVVPAPPAAGPHEAPPGFMFCPRCAKQNGIQLEKCWSCGMPFHPAMKPGAEPAEHNYAESSSLEAAAGGGSFQHAGPGEETVIKSDSVRTAADATFKVRCCACSKRFSGSEAKITAVQKCPKCGVQPFLYERV